MPITPDSPFPKASGDVIKSKDWNDTVNEVIRLDNAKVNRAGDALTGPLTAAGDTTNPNVSTNGVTGTGKVGVSGQGAADAQFVGIGVLGRGTMGVWGYGQGATNGAATYQGFGVYGRGDDYGVYGESSGYGVYGFGTEFGVYGQSSASTANTPTFAGFFRGDVKVTGSLEVSGVIKKSGGGFTIDHPLDPGNKYLTHAFVESPEMLNVYSGNVTTDDNGDAAVTLPDYFQALNKDLRYQLTVIGQFAQAIVATEVQDNRFTIKTDKPKVKVSWQVTGVRQDPWAMANPVVVEADKADSDRGLFMHPALQGLTELHSIDLARLPEFREQMRAAAAAAAALAETPVSPAASAGEPAGKPAAESSAPRPKRSRSKRERS